jgi:cyclopropane fatty-acyl-phospholipid synthase-like methyltransferase
MSLKKFMTKDHFAHKASNYEHNKDRVDNVANIADAIVARVGLRKSMQLMDFGSGTGLLLERIAPHVGKITAVDVSQSMNAQLREKQSRLACDVEILELDLEVAPLHRKFDGIISSMTMHHIKDVPAMFAKFHALLNKDGFIAIADLDLEDNSFHSEDTGVHHAGFERASIEKIAADAGFKNIEIVTASVIRKNERDYPVFLLVGVGI